MLRQLRPFLVVVFTLVTLVAAVAWQGGAPNKDSSGRVPALRSAGPTWYKGNLHTHSLWSDGDDFPEMIADWYKKNGYNFLGLSDHNILAEGDKWVEVKEKSSRPVALKKYRERFGPAWVEQRESKGKREVRLKPLAEFRSVLEEPGKFLMVPAEEVTHSYAKRPVHMNAINLRDVIKPVDGGSVAETISVNHRLVAEQAKKTRGKMVMFLNHPNWGYGVTAEDMIPVEELRFFEVFNGHPGIRNEGDGDHPSTDRIWDIVLAMRLGKHGLGAVHGLATDDSHRYHEWGVGKVNPGRGWIMVKAPYLSAEALVRAIDTGDFYASTGVILDDVKRTDSELSLKIRGEQGVTYRTEFFATMKDTSLESKPHTVKGGKPVTRLYDKGVGQVVAESSELSCSYKLTGKELYVRAKVTSSKPHPNPYKKDDTELAWTQPALPRK